MTMEHLITKVRNLYQRNQNEKIYEKIRNRKKGNYYSYILQKLGQILKNMFKFHEVLLIKILELF